jgi:hypothetical protein
MPTLLPGLIAVQFLGHRVTNQATSNTIHVAKPTSADPPDFTELQAIADQLYTWCGTQYNNLGDTGWTFDSIIARSVPNPVDPGIALEASHAVGTTGTRTPGSTTVPEGLCGLIFFQTPNVSRRFRGHIFAPPAIAGAAINGNNLQASDTYWTNLTAFRDKLRAGYATSRTWTGSSLSNYNLVLYSKVAAQQSTPPVANVQFVGVRSKASFLRSRERGAT